MNVGTNGISDHGFYYSDLTIDPGSIQSSDMISLGATDKTGEFTATASVDLIAGKLYYVRAFAVTERTGLIVLGQEYTFKALGSAPPTITDFSPKEGIAGDTVVITGTGFISIPDKNTVWFGDAYAPVTKASSHELSVVVPHSTILGNSNVSVDVVGRKVTATAQFSLTRMTVTSFEPNLVAIGDTVWFHGTNLPLVPSMSGATIFLRTAPGVASTRTLVGCVISIDAATTSSDITFVVGTQVAHFDGPIKLKSPVIDSFTPTSGMAGVAVTISGKNFNPDVTKNKVYFGAEQIEVLSATRTTLLVKIPPSEIIATSRNFTVEINDLLSGTIAQTFTVTDK